MKFSMSKIYEQTPENILSGHLLTKVECRSQVRKIDKKSKLLTNISLVFAILGTALPLPVTASSAGWQTSAPYFHASYYNDSYPDLQRAFGGNKSALETHWVQYGIPEGRSASPAFDPKWYLNNHVDLKQAFGNNYSLALQHWENNGVKEKRQSHPDFSVRCYLDRYSDLRAAFGNDYQLATLHYVNNGYGEKRDGRCTKVAPKIKATSPTLDGKANTQSEQASSCDLRKSLPGSGNRQNQFRSLNISGSDVLTGNGIYLIGSLDGYDNHEKNLRSYGNSDGVMRNNFNDEGPNFRFSVAKKSETEYAFSATVVTLPRT